MTELAPVPFTDLARRMRREVELTEAIFDLPVRKWWTPDATLDFSAEHFGRRVSTPVGPAAGPHTQLAQNIVLSWLAGGRIIELKTVQINDALTIPRPCIHVPNVGYNVEWSQELTVHESLMEYAKALYLIEILKETRAFGRLPHAAAYDTVFDISVGYDLEGIRSEKVTGFIRALQESAPLFAELRAQLDGDLAGHRDLLLPEAISQCVTLSTFHGCPANEIESIARYLIQDIGLNTIIKLNPTLLGYGRVKQILVDELGYHHLELRQEAFDSDLQYGDGLAMLHRLRDVARSHGTTIGAKFTNTLVVANNPRFFPAQEEPYMYLSGRPLHVISMRLMQEFREDLGFEIPVSFSAGVDARNFSAAVACGMVPITTCTDLLRQGGYGRLPPYLRALANDMRRLGVTSREAYVLAAHGYGAKAVEMAVREMRHGSGVWARNGTRLEQVASSQPDDLPSAVRQVVTEAGGNGNEVVLHATRIAGRLNGRHIVPPLTADARYHAASNQKVPRRIDSRLELYDCINCDLCISACPNDAIFPYTVQPVAVATDRLRLSTGVSPQRHPGRGYVMRESHQLAVLAAACNQCSNCDVYCPEHGAPFRLKERIFLTREQFAARPDDDGFCRVGNTMYARVDGMELRLDVDAQHGGGRVVGDGFQLRLSLMPFGVHDVTTDSERVEIDTATLWRMKTVWESVFTGPAPNMVNPHPTNRS